MSSDVEVRHRGRARTTGTAVLQECLPGAEYGLKREWQALKQQGVQLTIQGTPLNAKAVSE